MKKNNMKNKPKNKPFENHCKNPAKNEPDFSIPDSEPTGPAKPEERDKIVHGVGPAREIYEKTGK